MEWHDNALIKVIPYLNKDRKQVEIILQNLGLQAARASFFAESLEKDWNITQLSDEKKHWALSHGFFPSRIALYNLTEQNYKDYLSDFDYFRLHPLNNHFAIWVNDKLTLKYIFPKEIETLGGRKINIMPEYYLYIENDGHYSYLMDSPLSIAHNSDYLLNLVKEKKVLALKPSRGSGGYGFVKLEYTNSCIYANGEEIKPTDFNDFKDKLNGYLITAFVTQHTDLDYIWKDSVCTLRIVAVKNIVNQHQERQTDVIVSYARFGTSISHGASNLSSGGVGIAYDFNTGIFQGSFYKQKQFCENDSQQLECHPDTKVILKGTKLPHWNLVKDTVLTICQYLSSLDYFGFDIMITQEGIKLCEINTLPALDIEQVMHDPIFKNPQASKFFNEKRSHITSF